jgi:hypothetical protein
VPLLHLKFLFLRNTKILNFNGISKFHIWATFGKFWQFWEDFAALHAQRSPEILKTS